MHEVLRTLWFLRAVSAETIADSWLPSAAFLMKPVSHGKPFGASVGLGYSATTGLTATRTVDSQDEAFYEDGLWRYAGRFSYNYVSAAARVSANRLVLDSSAERFLSRGKANFLLVSVRFDRNPASGYAHYMVEAVGAGHRIFHSPRMGLKIEGGAGMRQNHYVNGAYADVPALRAALDYRWDLSGQSVFTERLGVLVARTGTLYSTDTSLSAPLAGALALKLSEVVDRYTSAPAGFPRTSTFSTINLLYHFP